MILQLVKDWWRGNLLGGMRSSRWPAVRKAFMAKNPLCAVCGTKGSLLKPNEAHHCIPYSVNPDLELDPKNLIVLCRDHHFFVGHLMNFKSFNRDVAADATIWRQKIKNRP